VRPEAAQNAASATNHEQIKRISIRFDNEHLLLSHSILKCRVAQRFPNLNQANSLGGTEGYMTRNEWEHEYHLTPEGWIRGNFYLRGTLTRNVPVPRNRVITMVQENTSNLYARTSKQVGGTGGNPRTTRLSKLAACLLSLDIGRRPCEATEKSYGCLKCLTLSAELQGQFVRTQVYRKPGQRERATYTPGPFAIWRDFWSQGGVGEHLLLDGLYGPFVEAVS
jgi:hypothetical protein